jgi:hypothetical protein
MLTSKQISSLRNLFATDSGSLIELVAERLEGRGVKQHSDAVDASRKAVQQVWTNPVIGGPAAIIFGGTVFSPYANVLAGGSTRSVGGMYDLLREETYIPLSDAEVQDATYRLVRGY